MNAPLNPAADKPDIEKVTENDFFENVPPGQAKIIVEVTAVEPAFTTDYLEWKPKPLLLYCTTPACSGNRYFDSEGNNFLKRAGEHTHFVRYVCRNCREAMKQYAIATKWVSETDLGIYKFGEVPQFGPPNPARLMNLLGGERDAYLKGRRCENQGLGIAAFAYYRRVVENQKAKIIGEILKVAEKLNADQALIEELEAAKAETRFSEAINRVKHGLPQVLLIDGHNPLLLLHSALSEGLHATSDEECLGLATSIRVVLTELVERMAIAVKEEAELTTAVQRLLQAGGKRKNQ